MSISLQIADIAESENTLYSYRSRDPDKPTNDNDVVIQPNRPSIFQVRPSSHHKLSVCSCLCCCCPVGLASFVYSYKTRKAKREGDFTEADRYSKSAKELAIASIVLGVFLLTVGGLIAVILYYTFLIKT